MRITKYAASAENFFVPLHRMAPPPPKEVVIRITSPPVPLPLYSKLLYYTILLIIEAEVEAEAPSLSGALVIHTPHHTTSTFPLWSSRTSTCFHRSDWADSSFFIYAIRTIIIIIIIIIDTYYDKPIPKYSLATLVLSYSYTASYIYR
eukprot:gene11386-7891_t